MNTPKGDLNVVSTDEDYDEDYCTEFLEETHEGVFAWECRVMAVSAFWGLPGVLLGVLARLCVPDGGPVSWWIAGGALLAAIFGGLLEADHLI